MLGATVATKMSCPQKRKRNTSDVIAGQMSLLLALLVAILVMVMTKGASGLINERKCPNFGPMESFREEGIVNGRVSVGSQFILKRLQAKKRNLRMTQF